MRKIMLLFIITALNSVVILAQNADSYYLAGRQKVEAKNFTGAIQDFTSAIKLNPKHEMAYVSRALCRMTQGEWSLAIPDCNKALQINPNQGVAYFVRGCAKANTKKNGCDDLKNALRLGYPKAQAGLDQFCND